MCIYYYMKWSQHETLGLISYTSEGCQWVKDLRPIASEKLPRFFVQAVLLSKVKVQNGFRSSVTVDRAR